MNSLVKLPVSAAESPAGESYSSLPAGVDPWKGTAYEGFDFRAARRRVAAEAEKIKAEKPSGRGRDGLDEDLIYRRDERGAVTWDWGWGD